MEDIEDVLTKELSKHTINNLKQFIRNYLKSISDEFDLLLPENKRMKYTNDDDDDDDSYDTEIDISDNENEYNENDNSYNLSLSDNDNDCNELTDGNISSEFTNSSDDDEFFTYYKKINSDEDEYEYEDEDEELLENTSSSYEDTEDTEDTEDL